MEAGHSPSFQQKKIRNYRLLLSNCEMQMGIFCNSASAPLQKMPICTSKKHRWSGVYERILARTTLGGRPLSTTTPMRVLVLRFTMGNRILMSAGAEIKWPIYFMGFSFCLLFQKCEFLSKISNARPVAGEHSFVGLFLPIFSALSFGSLHVEN